MAKAKKIIDFNCVYLDISDESIYEVESLYIYYQKLKTCYYMDYEHYIKWNRYISTSTIISTTAGVVAGGITLNPLILGVISVIHLVYISFYFHKKWAKLLHIIGNLQHKIGAYNTILKEFIHV